MSAKITLLISFASCSHIAVMNSQYANDSAGGLDGELKPK